MSEQVEFKYEGGSLSFPLMTASDGSKFFDVRELKEKTGLSAYDPDLHNTAIARSGITWIDAKSGRLLYRGIDVEELVEHSSFVETSYLLSNGELPTADQLAEYSRSLSKHSMIHESMRNFFDSFPGNAHPLAIMATMVTALSSYYPQSFEENIQKGIDVRTRLLAKVRTLAAWAYKKSVGQPTIYPRDDLPYCKNFLNMMFAVPAEGHTVTDDDDRVLNQILILYSDHEYNVATTTMRFVASTRANLFACINAGIMTLWGARESDANLPPIILLREMIQNSESPDQYFERFIKKGAPIVSNGLGHSAYGPEDPRATISRRIFHEYRKNHPDALKSPLIRKALEVEEYTLGHPFFKEMKLYPNLDFYSALIFHLLGIPSEMNNVIRVIGKVSGWLAHWLEQRNETERRSFRPRQVYTGKMHRSYIPMDQR
ncbi:MAG: citrate synthase [Leptospiraceae bacterium]|nr:citrate synthase [Leptospiraceae bacterium]